VSGMRSLYLKVKLGFGNDGISQWPGNCPWPRPSRPNDWTRYSSEHCLCNACGPSFA